MNETTEKDMELETIARRLAANVAGKPGENPDEIKIQLLGFYYSKYHEYDIDFRVNGSLGHLNLAEISTSLRNVYPECREPHRLAIVELDRVLKVHYQMEELLKAILTQQPKEIADKITELLNVKGDEK